VLPGAARAGQACRGRLAAQRAVLVLQRLRLCAMGDPRRLPRRMGDPRHIAYLLVPLAETEIVDDWQVLGLAGTGSKSLVLRDVFIPEHRCVMVADLFSGDTPGAQVHPEYPVLRAPRGFLVSYSLPPVCIALG